MLELICLHSSIIFASTQLIYISYGYLAQIILFNMNHKYCYEESSKIE